MTFFFFQIFYGAVVFIYNAVPLQNTKLSIYCGDWSFFGL